jgi:hypothetical protein
MVQASHRLSWLDLGISVLARSKIMRQRGPSGIDGLPAACAPVIAGHPTRILAGQAGGKQSEYGKSSKERAIRGVGVKPQVFCSSWSMFAHRNRTLTCGQSALARAGCGKPIEHRGDISPLALLGLQLVTAPARETGTSPQHSIVARG